MTIDAKDLLNSILSSLSRIDYIRPESIPNIDLYMDQITTFMDTQLAASKRHPDDKILTKTMINNYAKNNASTAGQEEIQQRTYSDADFHLLFQKHIKYQ